MQIDHYRRVRQELIDDYNRICHWTFRMQVPYQIYLTAEQVSEIDSTVKKGFLNLGDSLRSPRNQLISISILTELIKRLNSETFIGFNDPDDAVTIFEIIQRYLSNWMDIAEYAPQYVIPDIQELYDLEDVAVWVFDTYKSLVLQRQYIKNREAVRESKKIQSPFLALLNLSTMEENSEAPVFVSVLTTRLPKRLKDHYERTKVADVDRWIFDADNF